MVYQLPEGGAVTEAEQQAMTRAFARLAGAEELLVRILEGMAPELDVSTEGAELRLYVATGDLARPCARIERALYREHVQGRSRLLSERDTSGRDVTVILDLGASCLEQCAFCAAHDESSPRRVTAAAVRSFARSMVPVLRRRHPAVTVSLQGHDALRHPRIASFVRSSASTAVAWTSSRRALPWPGCPWRGSSTRPATCGSCRSRCSAARPRFTTDRRPQRRFRRAGARPRQLRRAGAALRAGDRAGAAKPG